MIIHLALCAYGMVHGVPIASDRRVQALRIALALGGIAEHLAKLSFGTRKEARSQARSMYIEIRSPRIVPGASSMFQHMDWCRI